MVVASESLAGGKHEIQIGVTTLGAYLGRDAFLVLPDIPCEK